MVTLNLEGRYYADPAIFAEERRRIFARSWQLVTHEDRLQRPGDYFATDLAGTNVFLIRGDDGEIRGFINVCSHRGAKLLADGAGHCAVVRCPYHDWHYDSVGRLIATPWFGRPSPFAADNWPLQSLQVRVWRRLVFAAIHPANTLQEQLGDLQEEVADAPIESFSPVESRRFEAAANWKTYIDQFVENYHVPRTHSPDKGVAIERFTAEPKGGIAVITAPTARSYGGKWIWAWPNWTLTVFDGGMKTSRINPLSPNRFEAYFEFFYADRTDVSAASRRRVEAATEAIFREDARACEQVQPAYSSGAYRPGPLHPELEASVAYFQSLVRSALEVNS